MTHMSTQRFLTGEAGKAGWHRERQARYVYSEAFVAGRRVLDLTPTFGSDGRSLATTSDRVVTWHSSRKDARRYSEQAGPSVSSVVAPSARSFLPGRFDVALALDPSHDVDLSSLVRSAWWTLNEGGLFILAVMNDQNRNVEFDVTTATQTELFDLLSPRFAIQAIRGQASELRANLTRTQPIVTCLPDSDIAVQAATVTSRVTVDSLYLIAVAEKKAYQPYQ